jgi:hypothetical protein
LFPIKADPPFYIFPQVHIKQIDITDMIIAPEEKPASGELGPVSV